MNSSKIILFSHDNWWTPHQMSVNAWTLNSTKIWILQILFPSHNILNLSKIIPFHICQQHVSTKSANDFCEKYTWDFFRFSHDNWWTPHQISAADSFEVVSHNMLCIPSTLNTDYLLWHTQLIVCAVKWDLDLFKTSKMTVWTSGLWKIWN